MLSQFSACFKLQSLSGNIGWSYVSCLATEMCQDMCCMWLLGCSCWWCWMFALYLTSVIIEKKALIQPRKRLLAHDRFMINEQWLCTKPLKVWVTSILSKSIWTSHYWNKRTQFHFTFRTCMGIVLGRSSELLYKMYWQLESCELKSPDVDLSGADKYMLHEFL